MHRQFPPLTSDAHFYQSGDVVIQGSVAIAPNVLLQADPGSRLVIAAGVCIGQGAILHASGGTLVIGAECCVGAGVLLIGSGTVGQYTCIGAGSTLYNPAIAEAQVVEPGSLQAGHLTTSNEISVQEAATTPASSASTQTPSSATTVERSKVERSEIGGHSNESNSPQTAQPSLHIVYGREYVESLLTTLLPHRQELNSPGNSQTAPPDELG